MARPLLTYDSGLGGLSVFRHLVQMLPNEQHLYVADDRLFPFGERDVATIRETCFATIKSLVEGTDPRAVVIACNTASTLVLPDLRKAFGDIFVGTVPAIKPAAALTQSGMISVLATPGTVKRDYTKNLIDTFAADVVVTLVGAPRLAALAEAYLRDGHVDEATLRAEIAPCFVQSDSARTDVVVLACTHYPLLLPVLEQIAPWPVTWVDPGPAVARRCVAVIAGLEGAAPQPSVGAHEFRCTSGVEFPLEVLKRL